MKFRINNVGMLVKSACVIFALAGVVSCQKSKDTPPPTPVIVGIFPLGYWSGTYTDNPTTEVEGNIAMLIKNNGIARFYDLGDKTDTITISPVNKFNATWTLSGAKLKLTYNNGNVMVVEGTISSSSSVMTGTWTANDAKGGTISLTK